MQVLALGMYASSGACSKYARTARMRCVSMDCMILGLYECDIPLSDIDMVAGFARPTARASCSPRWCAYRPETLLALVDNQSSANAQNSPVSNHLRHLAFSSSGSGPRPTFGSSDNGLRAAFSSSGNGLR